MSYLGTAHQFAFYTDLVTHIARSKSPTDIYELTDPDIVYRISSVIRLEKGDPLILFNSEHHIMGIILSITPKKSVRFEIYTLEQNQALTPHVTWLLPLLKRDAFEEALYTLTELGAHVIQPLVTQKTHRLWGGEKEAIRSQKIIIAAAEQSKQYVLPQLMPIIPFDIWLMQKQHPAVIQWFFDPKGKQLSEVIAPFQRQKPQAMLCMAGPEGDLTSEEKARLLDNNFTFCALTSTTLRAHQAITIGLGIIRSLLL